MNLSREVLETISNPRFYQDIIKEDTDYYAINLNNVKFDNKDVNAAFTRLYSDLTKKYIYNHLDPMADWNCCNKVPKDYNKLKKEYNFYYNNDIIKDAQVHIRFKWNFDGEKYSDRAVKIYLNFDNSVKLDTVGKIQAIMQKTKDFLYNWDKIEPDLFRDMENYISKIKAEDKRIEAEKQEIIAKPEKEDTEFIDFCKNFKA
jgi:hypothetical protein